MAEFTLPQGYLEPEKDRTIAALRAELAQVRVENARLEQWNNAVAVCEKHTGRIIASGCLRILYPKVLQVTDSAGNIG